MEIRWNYDGIRMEIGWKEVARKSHHTLLTSSLTSVRSRNFAFWRCVPSAEHYAFLNYRACGRANSTYLDAVTVTRSSFVVCLCVRVPES